MVADFGVEIVQERKVVDLVKNYSGEVLMELMHACRIITCVYVNLGEEMITQTILHVFQGEENPW